MHWVTNPDWLGADFLWKDYQNNDNVHGQPLPRPECRHPAIQRQTMGKTIAPKHLEHGATTLVAEK
jgi:hypothetical protein